MGKLEAFASETDPLRQNRLLFDWLRDDLERTSLYADLKNARPAFPILRFKSVMRAPSGPGPWPGQDVYLVSHRDQVVSALQHYSVRPYAELDSHGRFMLGADAPADHDWQHKSAQKALCYSADEVAATAREAVRRALVLPTKGFRFDVVEDVAQQAALRFAELLFGLPAEAHVLLAGAMLATYTRLSFQIVGRHFVADPGLPSTDSSDALRLRGELEAFVRDAVGVPGEVDGKPDDSLQRRGLPAATVIGRLRNEPGRARSDLPLIALGLVAGTIGNVTAAVSIALDHILAGGNGGCSINEAMEAARELDRRRLRGLIDAALKLNPPAPFLARTSRGTCLQFDGRPLPEGQHVLLALGADPTESLRFGGDWCDTAFPHRCVGRHLAEPLVVETVAEVLKLPGLSRVIDPRSGKPQRLKKRWGAICTTFPLQFRRDQRLNQQSLHVVLPIKEPVGVNAAKLMLLTRAGAYIIEDALKKSRHVHFAWFNIVENGTHLAMSTTYDGDFDAYVEFFALEVPLFDEQFKFLDVFQPLPIRKHPKEFVDNIRKYNREPLGGYFFSAYPLIGVADIDNAEVDRP